MTRAAILAKLSLALSGGIARGCEVVYILAEVRKASVLR